MLEKKEWKHSFFCFPSGLIQTKNPFNIPISYFLLQILISLQFYIH